MKIQRLLQKTNQKPLEGRSVVKGAFATGMLFNTFFLSTLFCRHSHGPRYGRHKEMAHARHAGCEALFKAQS